MMRPCSSLSALPPQTPSQFLLFWPEMILNRQRLGMSIFSVLLEAHANPSFGCSTANLWHRLDVYCTPRPSIATAREPMMDPCELCCCTSTGRDWSGACLL